MDESENLIWKIKIGTGKIKKDYYSKKVGLRYETEKNIFFFRCKKSNCPA